jgi:hypothetical protein
MNDEPRMQSTTARCSDYVWCVGACQTKNQRTDASDDIKTDYAQPMHLNRCMGYAIPIRCRLRAHAARKVRTRVLASDFGRNDDVGAPTLERLADHVFA